MSDTVVVRAMLYLAETEKIIYYIICMHYATELSVDYNIILYLFIII